MSKPPPVAIVVVPAFDPPVFDVESPPVLELVEGDGLSVDELQAMNKSTGASWASTIVFIGCSGIVPQRRLPSTADRGSSAKSPVNTAIFSGRAPEFGPAIRAPINPVVARDLNVEKRRSIPCSLAT